MVLLRRDDHPRPRQPVYGPEPAGAGSARRAPLAHAGTGREVFRAGSVDRLQPDLLARRLPHVPGPLASPAGASRRDPGGPVARLQGRTPRGRVGRPRCRGSATPFRRCRQGPERPPPPGVRAGADEPGADVPVGRRHDAVADQVRGAGPRGHLRRTPVRPEPGHSVLGARCGALGRRVERASDWRSLPGARVPAHRPGRGRRVSVTGCAALVPHGRGGGRLPLHRRRPCPGREALRRRGKLPVPGLRGAAGHGRPGGAAALRPPPAARPELRRPALRKGPARFGPGLDRGLRTARQREGRGRPVRRGRQIRLRELQRAVGDHVVPRRGEGATPARSLHGAASGRRRRRRARRNGVRRGGGRAPDGGRAVRPRGGATRTGRRSCGSSTRRRFLRKAATAGACP